MYADAYYNVIDRLDYLIGESENPADLEKYTLLRQRITRKFLRFYFKKFARQFLLSEDEEWREENFEVMKDISKDFDTENYKRNKKEKLKCCRVETSQGLGNPFS